jgi:hypothetical protein
MAVWTLPISPTPIIPRLNTVFHKYAHVLKFLPFSLYKRDEKHSPFCERKKEEFPLYERG